MIYIDFIGGAHGNYLEFICNKFLAKIKIKGSPFNDLGASHSKKYLESKVFENGHYHLDCNWYPKEKLLDSQAINISIQHQDLLPLQSISLLRAGDYNIDPDQLEVDTYNKWDNKHYQWVRDNLINGFFTNQLQSSYNAVKDSSWPLINSIRDFKNLPNWIQEECTNVHNLTLHELNADNPDCPRNILREFFKLGFKYPEQNGFITVYKNMTYDVSTNVSVFPYGCFYNTEQFIIELKKLAHDLGYTFEPDAEFLDLHEQFLTLQIYKDSKIYCDKIIDRIKNREQFNFPKLDLLQESYLTAQLELCYNIELTNNLKWFKNSQEVLNEC